MQESAGLHQVLMQLLQKLHQATSYAKLQKQLLLACVLLLDDLRSMAADNSLVKVCWSALSAMCVSLAACSL